MICNCLINNQEMYMFPVPQVDADKCKSVIEICCLDERKNDQCKIGKDLAKLRRTCAGLQNRLGNEHKRVWSYDFGHIVDL